MKKILFIVYSRTLGGGAEKILNGILNGLAQKTDYEISVIEYAHFEVKKEALDPKIRVLPPIVDMTKESKISRLFKLVLVHLCPALLQKKHIKEHFDAEISFNYQIPSFLTKKNTYNIQWIHGSVSDLKSAPFKRFLQRKSFRKADRIVAISENTKKSILALFPEFEEKIQMIYNGTDLAGIEKASSKDMIEMKENALIFLGRIEPNKNPIRLIEYTEKLLHDGMKVSLYLLGTGIQDEEIKKIICEKGLGDYIFPLGYIQNPYPYIKKSAAVCVFSESEGFPTVITEGMALGIPFISTYVGGTAELSNHGKCGLLFKTYEEFKQAVSQIVFNEEKKEEMKKNCKEHIKLFSYETQIQNVIDLIENR